MICEKFLVIAKNFFWFRKFSKIFEKCRNCNNCKNCKDFSWFAKIFRDLQKFFVICEKFFVIAKNFFDIENLRKFSKILEKCRDCNSCKNCKNFSWFAKIFRDRQKVFMICEKFFVIAKDFFWSFDIFIIQIYCFFLIFDRDFEFEKSFQKSHAEIDKSSSQWTSSIHCKSLITFFHHLIMKSVFDFASFCVW